MTTASSPTALPLLGPDENVFELDAADSGWGTDADREPPAEEAPARSAQLSGSGDVGAARRRLGRVRTPRPRRSPRHRHRRMARLSARPADAHEPKGVRGQLTTGTRRGGLLAAALVAGVVLVGSLSGGAGGARHGRGLSSRRTRPVLSASRGRVKHRPVIIPTRHPATRRGEGRPSVGRRGVRVQRSRRWAAVKTSTGAGRGRGFRPQGAEPQQRPATSAYESPQGPVTTIGTGRAPASAPAVEPVLNIPPSGGSPPPSP